MRISPLLPSLIILVLGMVSAAPTHAAGETTKTRTIDAQSIKSIVLKAGVGSVRVEPGSGEKIEARVVLRASRSCTR